MKDKFGNKLTRKEYFERWKQGLQGVTPLQSTTIQIKSTWIMLFGLLAGIVITLFAFKQLWWVFLILIGGLGNTLMQQLGLWQKKKLLQRFETSLIESEGGKIEMEVTNIEGTPVVPMEDGYI